MTNRARVALLLASFPLLAACAGMRSKPTEPPVLRVTLQRVAHRFVARIDAGAARELRFERPTAGREKWRVRGLAGPLPLVRDGPHDVLRAAAPRGRLGALEIELPIDERPPEKDYRGFLRYSQGGVRPIGSGSWRRLAVSRSNYRATRPSALIGTLLKVDLLVRVPSALIWRTVIVLDLLANT